MAEAEPVKRKPARRASTARTADPVVAKPPAEEVPSPAVAALVRLALLDGALDPQPSVALPSSRQRESLLVQVPPEVLDAYERALRAGRRPAVTAIDGSVCRGCNMRLHSSLAQRIQSRGAAACPHCLRVVYSPATPAPRS